MIKYVEFFCICSQFNFATFCTLLVLFLLNNLCTFWNNILFFFFIFTIINNIGLKQSFFMNLNNILKGIHIILNIFWIIFFIKLIIVTFIFIIYELTVIIYNRNPKMVAININHLISPLLNVNIEYSKIIAVKIQNKKSSIIVIKSDVFIVLLDILKMSNISPIIIPSSMKIKNKTIWFTTI